MSEFGTSLTVVGIVATVISLLFAAASLYVSHRQRHIATHPAKAHIPKNAAALQNPSAPQPPASLETFADGASNASAMPFFRKLGVHGLEETQVHEQQTDSTYIWE